MKILIVSDTHRRDAALRDLIEDLKPLDMFIHLGDAEGSESKYAEWVNPTCRMEMVRGNNDFFSMLDKEREIRIGSHPALMTHGHLYKVSQGPEQLKREALARGCDIAMFGHTHKPYLKRSEDIIVLNPGSLSFPRQGGRQPSYIVMEITDRDEVRIRQEYLE